MGLTNDKLLQLEEEGVIVWNDEKRSYVAVAAPDEPFDLAEYLYNKSKEVHGY